MDGHFAKLSVILDALWDVRTKWYFFGLALGIDETSLDAINGKDDDACFRMMISKWLKLCDPQPSWEILVRALCSPSVGRKDLATAVAVKYCVSMDVVALGMTQGELCLRVRSYHRHLGEKTYHGLTQLWG